MVSSISTCKYSEKLSLSPCPACFLILAPIKAQKSEPEARNTPTGPRDPCSRRACHDHHASHGCCGCHGCYGRRGCHGCWCFASLWLAAWLLLRGDGPGQGVHLAAAFFCQWLVVVMVLEWGNEQQLACGAGIKQAAARFGHFI